MALPISMRASVLALVASVATGLDVASTLRAALMVESEDAVPLSFDLGKLHKQFPDPSHRSIAERIGSRGPAVLLDLAFTGAQSSTPHTKEQQALQTWLFSRCLRLPTSGSAEGLREQCKKKLATAAVALEQGSSNAVEVAKIRSEAVVAAGLGLRSTYMTDLDSEIEAAADVKQASTAAHSDSDLQRLMRLPHVKAAMERIAADPSSIRELEQDPDVHQVLQKLNGFLKG